MAQSLPVLHWQRGPGHGAGYAAGGGSLDLSLALLLTNVGPGPARLLDFEAGIDGDGPMTAPGLAMPSTLPQGERIDLKLSQTRAPNQYPGECTVSIRLRYTDLANLRTYETRPKVVVAWVSHIQGQTGIMSLDADEQSPAARQV